MRERCGRQFYLGINERCLIVPDLRSMFVKSVGLADVLRACLAELSEQMKVAFIFGSAQEARSVLKAMWTFLSSATYR
ncbi:MAG: hypothetical protein KatS3mg024_1546 [Armatimonadota bacterium]|nr:MAG: hypothetical protein KatS3mg024_1546 [Armatimonadota bacterium]